MDNKKILNIKNGIYNLLLSIKNNKHVFDKTIEKSPDVLDNNKLEQDADNIHALFNDITKTTDGGKGSGNFGHKGRPGKRGGSSKNGGGAVLSKEQVRSVWEEYCKRVNEGEKTDHMGFTYHITSEAAWEKHGGSLRKAINKIIETGEGIFKTDEDVDKAEQQYEEAVKNGDKALAKKLQSILRWNMTIEAMYDVSQEMYNNEPVNNNQNAEPVDNKQNEPIQNDITTNTKQEINGYDITNDSEIFNEKGEADLQIVDLNIPEYKDEQKTEFIKKMNFDKNAYDRFNNILEINKSEFINFCNSNTEQKQEYKNNSEQYEKELLDENSDLSYYLKFPSLIDTENKNKIFSIAFNNYDKSDLIQEQKDVEYTYKLPFETKQFNHTFNEKQSAFIHEGLDGIFDTNEKLGQFIADNGGLSEIYVPNYSDRTIDDEIDRILTSIYDSRGYNLTKPTKSDIKRAKKDYVENFIWDRGEWERGGQLFSNFLIQECLLNKCEGLEKADAQKAMLDFMYGLQDGKSLKNSKPLSIEYNKNAEYEVHNLSENERMLLNGFLIKNDFDLRENKLLEMLRDFGYSKEELFGNYDNEKYMQAVCNDVMGIDYFETNKLPINYIILKECINNLIDTNTIEFSKEIDRADKEIKLKFVNDLTNALLNNDTKKLDEFKQKRYINDLYKTLGDGVSSIELKNGSNKKELSNKMSQILGNISELTDMPLEQINNSYVNSLYRSDKKAGKDLFTLFNEISANTQRVALEDEVEYVLNVLKNQNPERFLKNLNKNMQFNERSIIRAFNLYGLLGQIIKNKDFMNSTEEQQKSLLEQYAKNLVDIYEDKNVSILPDNSKYKKMSRGYLEQKEVKDKISGNLIKQNTKELDAFINELSNIQYNENHSYFGIDNMELLSKQNIYSPDDFEGLKLTKKQKETLQFLNKKINKGNGKIAKEIKKKIKAFVNSGFDKNNMIKSLQNDLTKDLSEKYINEYDIIANAYILKGMKNINEDDIKNKNIRKVFNNVLNKITNNQPTKTTEVSIRKALQKVPEDFIKKYELHDDKKINDLQRLLKYRLGEADNDFETMKNRLYDEGQDAKLKEFFNYVSKEDVLEKRNIENRNLPSYLKANRIASKYNTIKNKPDVKSNFLDTTVIKDVDITKDNWTSENSASFLNKLLPLFNISKTLFADLIMGADVSSIMGKNWIGEQGQDEFENLHKMTTQLAKNRQESSEGGFVEPVNEKIKTKNNLAYTSDNLRRVVFSMTSSGASYTSAVQEDEGGMGSFIRMIAASAPVMEGEFLRCESASDNYRDYDNMKVGDSITFNAQHFTYDPNSFGKAASDMFGEIGFRVKGKVPFLNMMSMVKPGKMTEWEGLMAGCFKIKEIHENVSEYGADFTKLIDLEFDWNKWKNYIHANAKMFANQLGLYDRNGKMKIKDFLNFLLKMRLKY